MSPPRPDAVLDRILATQFLVAWAGESRHLGWWRSDLVDPEAGGDLLRRLLPKTAAWARFEAAREAARRVDEAMRRRASDGDAVRTLFFLGFEVDEQLDARLAALKKAGAGQERGPTALWRFPSLPGADLEQAGGKAFHADAFAAALVQHLENASGARAGGTSAEVLTSFTKSPIGRQLKPKGNASDKARWAPVVGREDELIHHLCAGLLPLSEAYPLPFFRGELGTT